MCLQTSFYHGAPEGSIPNVRFYYKYLETHCDELAKIKGATLKVIGLLQQPLFLSSRQAAEKQKNFHGTEQSFMKDGLDRVAQVCSLTRRGGSVPSPLSE